MFTFGDNSSSLSVGVFSQTIASTVKESMEGKGRKWEKWKLLLITDQGHLGCNMMDEETRNWLHQNIFVDRCTM